MAQQQRRGGGNNNSRQSSGTDLTVVQPARLPMPAQAAQEYGITAQRWQALVEAVYPSAKSVTGVMLALSICKARNLDVFKRPVHIVPMYNSALKKDVETVWLGIGEMRITASRTGQWAGNDEVTFGRLIKKSFSETKSGNGNNGPWSQTASAPEMTFPEWAQMTVYRFIQGNRVPFVGPKVYFEETFSGEKGMRVPNSRWRQAPRQMLEKCAEAAALRRAFPEELAGEYIPEEMEGKPTTAVPTETFTARYAGDDAQQQGDGIQEAEVVDVDDQQGQQGSDQDDNDQQPNEPQWDDASIATYMGNVEGFLSKVSNMARFESAIAIEQQNYETLPDQQRDHVRQLVADTRKRLEEAENAKPPAEQTGFGFQAPDGAGSDDEPPFVRNLGMRLDEVKNVEQLDTLLRSEQRSIDAQPEPIRLAAQKRVDETRASLASE